MYSYPLSAHERVKFIVQREFFLYLQLYDSGNISSPLRPWRIISGGEKRIIFIFFGFFFLMISAEITFAIFSIFDFLSSFTFSDLGFGQSTWIEYCISSKFPALSMTLRVIL